MNLEWDEDVWNALSAAELLPDEEGEDWDTSTYDGKPSVPREVVAALQDLKDKIQEIADTQ